MHQCRAEAASNLARDDVGLADLIFPVALPHGDDRKLGQDGVPADGGVYSLLGEQNTPADMSVVILNGKCLEPGPRASASLLSYGHNF